MPATVVDDESTTAVEETTGTTGDVVGTTTTEVELEVATGTAEVGVEVGAKVEDEDEETTGLETPNWVVY